MLRRLLVGITCVSMTLVAGCGGGKGKPGPGGTAGADPAGFPTDFITSDAIGALMVHPARFFKSALGKALLENEEFKSSLADSPMDPVTIDSIYVLLAAASGGPAPVDQPAMVMRFNQAVDSGPLLEDVLGPDPAEGEYNGKKYFTGGPMGNAGMMYDEKTLLVANEELLKKMVDAAGPQDSPLIQGLSKMDRDQGLLGLFLVEGAREQLGQAAQMAASNPMLAPMADLADKLQSIEVTMDAENKQMLRVAVNTSDEESATKAKAFVDMMVGMAKVGYPNVKQQFAADPSMEQVGPLLDEMVSALAAEQDGVTVQIVAQRPENMDAVVSDLIKAAMSAANGPPDTWQEREFPEQKFAASFPQETDVAEITTPGDEDPEVLNEWDVFAFSNSTESDYAVRVALLRPERVKAGAAKIFADKLEFVDNVTDKKDIQVAGHPGVEYKSSLDFGATKVTEVHRLVLIEDMLYDLNVSGTGPDLDTEIFFNSFRPLGD